MNRAEKGKKMTASRDSVAYQQYEERFPVEQKRELRAAPAPRRRKKTRSTQPVCMHCILAVAAYILFCQMQLTELTRR